MSGLAAPAAGRGSPCVAKRPPKVVRTYTSDVFSVKATFALTGCGSRDMFETGFMLTRDGVVSGEGMAGGGACFGRRANCVMRIGLAHEPVERSAYSLELFYRTRGGNQTLKRAYVCTSAVVSASCD